MRISEVTCSRGAEDDGRLVAVLRGGSASVVSITPPKENPAKQRLIRLREVRLRVGLGTSTVYRYLAGGKFPRPVQIGGGRVAWLETDVDAWIVDRVEASGRGAT